MSETVERKPFKSIHIDTEKGIYLLNGEKVSMVSRIDLEFNNGKWSLLITRDELYAQEATKEEKAMPGYNFNHFTGKTKGKALRKKKVRVKRSHKNKYEQYSNNKETGR